MIGVTCHHSGIVRAVVMNVRVYLSWVFSAEMLQQKPAQSHARYSWLNVPWPGIKHPGRANSIGCPSPKVTVRITTCTKMPILQIFDRSIAAL